MGLFELIYYLGYRVKRAYDLGKQKRLPLKVISIGNITTGGTGKTPLTIALVREAVQRGFRPVVLTRGYKGKAKGPCLITTEMSEEDAGDEPLLMAEKLPGVPVIKGKDRYNSGMFALTGLTDRFSSRFTPTSAISLFILDDGFQHRRLYRDKDILLINAGDPFDNRRLLPLGLLREPLKEIKRADIIVITKGGQQPPETGQRAGATGKQDTDIHALMDEIKKYNPQAPLFTAEYSPSYIRTIEGQHLPVEQLSGRDVYAFCGIADPDSFKNNLEQAGARLRGFKAYSDHFRFRRSDLARIKKAADDSGAEWIITTEKDMMRLNGMEGLNGPGQLPENLVSLGVEFTVEKGFYEEVFKDAQVH